MHTNELFKAVITMVWSLLLVTVAAVLLAMHLRDYSRLAAGLSIWQLPARALGSDVLRYKQPVVIDGFSLPAFKAALPLHRTVPAASRGLLKVAADGALVCGPCALQLLHGDQANRWAWHKPEWGWCTSAERFESKDAEYVSISVPENGALLVPYGWVVNITEPLTVYTVWSLVGFLNHVLEQFSTNVAA